MEHVRVGTATPFPTPCSEAAAKQAIGTNPYVHRKLFCRFYLPCLDYAIERRWQNFTCIHCEVDLRQDMDQIQSDNEALMKVLGYITEGG